MTDARLLALLRLNAVPYFSPDAVRRLLASLPAEEALGASAENLSSLMGVSPEKAQRFRATALAFDAEAELEAAQRLGARVLPWDDLDYPQALRDIADCPLLLYVQGDPGAAAPAAAVIGSRGPTPYGRRMARRLAGELSQRGVTVVSGLARGIDGEAHEGALARGGRTWAVLGSGLERVYPPENEPLARRIVEGGGCLLTEHPLRAGPQPHHFPRRNRYVAALSWALVVVEGRLKSGSRITAHIGAELGRLLFAVPGPADSPLSEFPHELLRDGARPACGADDLLATLDPAVREALKASAPRPGPAFVASLSLEYRNILEYIGADSVTVDALAEGTGLDVSQLSNILFEMELQGLLSPFPGQRYAKKVI